MGIRLLPYRKQRLTPEVPQSAHRKIYRMGRSGMVSSLKVQAVKRAADVTCQFQGRSDKARRLGPIRYRHRDRLAYMIPQPGKLGHQEDAPC